MLELFINTFTHPAFTAIVGFLCGHYFNIWRERRNERNDAAEALFKILFEARNSLNPCDGRLSSIEFAKFRWHLQYLKRRAFDRRIEDYNKAKNDSTSRDDYGGVFYHETSTVVAAIDKLMKLTEKI